MAVEGLRAVKPTNIYNEAGLTRVYLFGRWAIGLDWKYEPKLVTLWLFSPWGEHALDIHTA